jgi:hypothetical protein
MALVLDADCLKSEKEKIICRTLENVFVARLN